MTLTTNRIESFPAKSSANEG